jgi:hypothetical protein
MEECIKWPARKWKNVRCPDEAHFCQNPRLLSGCYATVERDFERIPFKIGFQNGASESRILVCIGRNFKEDPIFYGLEGVKYDPGDALREILSIVKNCRDEPEARYKGSSIKRITTTVTVLEVKRIRHVCTKIRSIVIFVDDWPGSSSDLSSIENVSHSLKPIVRQSVQGLRVA